MQSDDAPRRRWPRLNLRRDWPGLAAMLFIAVTFSAIPAIRVFSHPEENKDYSRWWNAAMSVRHGEPLFPVGDVHMDSFIYPPASAVLFYTPLSVLGYLPMVLMVAALTFAGYLAAIAISVWYARGQASGQPPGVYVVPVAVTLGFAWDTYILGQPNLMLLGIMLLGFLAIDRMRPLLAGWLFAIAAAIKAFPVMVIGYLVWRRHFKAAASLIVSAVLILVVLPAPFRGFDRNVRELWTWIDRMVLSNSGTQLADQPGRAFRYGNQSLMSVVHRLTRHVEAGDPSDPLYVNVVDIGPRGAFLVFAAIAGVFCLAFVAAMPPKRQLTRRILGLEYSILLILIIWFSPKAGTYYYSWTLPGLVMITSAAIDSPYRSRRWWVLWVCLASSIIITASGLAQVFGMLLPQAMGAMVWGSLIVLATLLGLLAESKRRLARGTEPGGGAGVLT